MNCMRERKIKSPGVKRVVWRMMCICVLMAALSGCSLVVSQADYQEDKEQNKKEIESIRGQLLAHTQILANHGKSLNEFKLQLRDAVSNLEKAVKEVKGKFEATVVSTKPAEKKESAVKPVQQSETFADARYVRRTFRGLSLSYAGGYDVPRGSRYPYRLEPGTRVTVISGDQRGFTQVVVRSGRWAGKKMWVRTRWLTKQAPKHAEGGKS